MSGRFTSALILLGVLWTGATVQAQTATSEDVYLEADSVSFQRTAGREVSMMIQARLTQGETRLTSDRARDEGNGYVQFWGNVVIVQEQDTVRAERIRYHKDTKIGVATGSVFLTDGTVVLSAPSATYDAANKVTVFEEGVRFQDSLTVLTAGRGRYDSTLERADFAFLVRMERDDSSVWADSVSFLRPTDEAWAVGRVAAVSRDSTGTESAHMFSDWMYRAERADSSRVAGNVLMARFDAASSDTLMVTAQRALVQGARLVAQDSVVVIKGSSALRGDSLEVREYTSSESGISESRMFGSVAAWLGTTQLAADSLRLQQLDAGVDSMHADGGVFVARQDSATGRINQMRARGLEALVVRDSLRSMMLSPNAETLLYVFQEEDERTIAFKVTSDAVRLAFNGPDVSRVTYLGQTSGTEYTQNLFGRLSNLRDYIWTPERRPDRDRVRDRSAGLAADRIRRQASTDQDSTSWH